MFTAEKLETTWKQMKDYERENFGRRFGEDFAMVANILRQSKEFMTTGGVTLLLAGLEMSSMSKAMQSASSEGEKSGLANGLMEKPNAIHNTLAELFYLGYALGKQSSEVEVLK